MAYDDLYSWLRLAQLALWKAREQMLLSGALPDAVHEITEDMRRLESWLLQLRSTIDEELVQEATIQLIVTYADYADWGHRLLGPGRP